jgi:hypothetical protein
MVIGEEALPGATPVSVSISHLVLRKRRNGVLKKIGTATEPVVKQPSQKGQYGKSRICVTTNWFRRGNEARGYTSRDIRAYHLRSLSSKAGNPRLEILPGAFPCSPATL